MAAIELDNEFLELFYGVTDGKAPKEMSLNKLKEQMLNIIDLLKELNANVKKPIHNKYLMDEEKIEEIETSDAILVIDDLGVITFQLKHLLSEFDLDIDCSQEIYDALTKYKKRGYKYVIMDLFIPTEREGFILLSELKKISKQKKYDSIIGVMTASGRKEIEQQCKTMGTDFFIEKNNDWQKTLLRKLSGYLNQTDDDNI